MGINPPRIAPSRRRQRPHAEPDPRGCPGQLICNTERTAPRPWFWGRGWRDLPGRILHTGLPGGALAGVGLLESERRFSIPGPSGGPVPRKRAQPGWVPCTCACTYTLSVCTCMGRVSLAGSHSELNSALVQFCIRDRSFPCSLIPPPALAAHILVTCATCHLFNSPTAYFELARSSCFIRAAAPSNPRTAPPRNLPLPPIVSLHSTTPDLARRGSRSRGRRPSPFTPHPRRRQNRRHGPRLPRLRRRRGVQGGGTVAVPETT